MSLLNVSAFIQNSTVASNINTSFQGAIKDLGSAANGLLASAPGSSSITGSLGSLSTLLGSSGLSTGSSSQTALESLSTLGSYTKFGDTFRPPNRLSSITPEEAYKRDQYKGSFSFPSDLGKYYVSYTFKKYSRIAPINEPKELSQVTISLPIPTNLIESFNVTYADKSLGVAKLLTDTIGEAVKSNTAEGFKKAGEELRNVAENQGIYYAGRTAIGGISDNLGAAADVVTGTILNPNQAMIFQGLGFRSHSFTYRFSPNSKNESILLKKIINEFKKRMLPQVDKLLMQFPDVVDIRFGLQEGTPYFFKTCFLESMTVNYAPQGQPAFFGETNEPVEVELTLNFKETELVTRKDIVGPSLSE